MGNGALAQLAGVIANVAGASQGNSSSLLGILAAIILGALKKKVIDSRVNPGSLCSLLTEQKDNIGAAMPQAFSSQLHSTGFFESIAPETLAALGSESTSNPVPLAAAPAAPAPTQNKSGGGIMKWLLPLIAVAGIAWFGTQYMNKQAANEAAAQAEVAAKSAAEAAAQAATEKAEAVKLQAEEAQQNISD